MQEAEKKVEDIKIFNYYSPSERDIIFPRRLVEFLHSLIFFFFVCQKSREDFFLMQIKKVSD